MEQGTPRKRGRPVLPVSARRGTTIQVRALKTERARMEAAAACAGKNLSEWARQKLLTDLP